MNYESAIKKFLQIFEKENQNKFDSDNLKDLNLVRRDESYRKTIGLIRLVKGFNVQTGTTIPTGFVNPLLTITNFSPNITPPVRIFPVLLDFVAGQDVTIPDALLSTVAKLLLVATSSNEAPVPDVESDLAGIKVNVTPKNGSPTPLIGTPTFIAPGVIQIPLTQAETTVAGTNPFVTITVGNGVLTQNFILNLNTPLTLSPSVAPNIFNNGVRPINNPGSVVTIPDNGGMLGSTNIAPVPTFHLSNLAQLNNTFNPPPIVINPVGE